MRMFAVVVFLIALAALAGGWYLHQSSDSATTYRTAIVTRGDLLTTINSTGTLEPEEVVDVGAQVAGLIVSFGKDSNGEPIDYRSPVEPDMVLARIDDKVYKADVDTAMAQLDQAKAMVLEGEAGLSQSRAKLLQAEHNWTRAKTIGPSDAMSQNDYDMYQADYASAVAAVAVADAQVAHAKSGIALAEAELTKAQRNFDFCTIRSPVKGVIIDRRVNVGQTVVSSLNAPSLFLLARDLTRMQIWVAVNEADVGRIVPGTPVTFHCDAFPDQKFEGSVGKVRLNATMSQNVVMYTVEVKADNPAGKLLPYLTAKVQFQVNKVTDTLLVPNAALRWTPSSPAAISPAFRDTWKPVEEKPVGAEASSRPTETSGTVWIKDGTFVRPVEVKLGLTDRSSTAIAAEGLADGTEIVVGEASRAAEAGQKNPFLPSVQRR